MASIPGSANTIFGPPNVSVTTVPGSFTNPPVNPNPTTSIIVEVFPTGTAEPAGFTVNPGVAAIFISGSPPTTTLVTSSSLTFIDTGGNESIAITFPPGDPSVTVVGSKGDTITGASSTVPGDTQLIDASGKNPAAIAGPMTIIGGSVATTIWGGAGDSITAGAGSTWVAGDLANGQTIAGGSGNLTIFDLGKGDKVTGSTGGFTFIDDNYGGGGNTIVGGGGTGIATTPLGTTVGAGTFVVGGQGDQITGGSGSMLVNGLDGSMTIDGGIGTSTIWGAGGDSVVGGSGAMQVSGNAVTVTGGSGNLYVIGGTGDSVAAGGGSSTVAGGSAETITGGTGNLQVDAITGSTVTGGPGNLSVLGLGTGNSVVGSTGAATFIDDSYTSTTTGAFTGGSNTLTGGAGNSTIVAGPGDSISGGTGALLAQFHSALPGSETATLSTVAGRGAATIADLNDLTGSGTKVTVTGFNTTTDQILSAQSVSGTTFIGTSASDGKGGTVLTFKDGTTMDIVGVASVTSIKFIT
jgi:hypothetical protein